ncbi:MAG: GNAT family N-acetyltransferase [Archangium sp.]|nr:GNAT family N-acetyltransferase [Archangium sp.]MDP3156165.1 GNAT family N-acetyltransferase [Archangium sp.]MDP3571502.1 GNAT family N-acetyltransferase [Archangium sp.]
MFKRGRRTSVREAVNEKAESLLSLCGATLREGTVLIAQAGDDLLGVAVLRLYEGEAEILALVTDPNHRHQGVGRQLVLEMSRRARVARCTVLRVRIAKTDDAVLGFFRGLGFDETYLAFDLSL